MAKKQKRKLDAPPPQPKVPFNLPEPNDDLAAYGWHMNRLRYPSKNSTPGDVWAGTSIFAVEEAEKDSGEYGMDVWFMHPPYLQYMLDHSVDVQNAVLACKKKKYSNASIVELRKAVMKAVHELILPDIEQRLKQISVFIAAYYAAKMAHIDTYGFDA